MHSVEDVQGYAGFTALNRGVCAARSPVTVTSVCAPIVHTEFDFECASFIARALEGLLCTQ